MISSIAGKRPDSTKKALESGACATKKGFFRADPGPARKAPQVALFGFLSVRAQC